MKTPRTYVCKGCSTVVRKFAVPNELIDAGLCYDCFFKDPSFHKPLLEEVLK